MSRRASPGWDTWFWPVVLGAVSAVGLITALVGDGAWDAVSWLTLGLVTAAAIWFGKFADRSGAR